jgi:hypothetical protein
MKAISISANRPDEPGAISAAEHQALRQMIADLPRPESYAATLPLALIKALISAYRTTGGMRLCDLILIGHLRRLGLVEFGGPYLTNFGTAVRRALMERAKACAAIDANPTIAPALISTPGECNTGKVN